MAGGGGSEIYILYRSNTRMMARGEVLRGFGGGVQNRYFYPTCIHVMIHTLFSLRYSESFGIERRRRSRRFAEYRPRIYVVITIMCAFFLPHSHDFQMEYLNVVCVQRTITTLYKNMTFIRNYFWFSTFVFAFVFF